MKFAHSYCSRAYRISSLSERKGENLAGVQGETSAQEHLPLLYR